MEKQEQEYKVSPLDSGWSWVVLIVVTLTLFSTAGFSASLGIYYVHFLDIFNEGKVLTAMTTSVNYAVLCGVGT